MCAVAGVSSLRGLVIIAGVRERLTPASAGSFL